MRSDLGEVAPGQFEELTEQEMEQIKKAFPRLVNASPRLTEEGGEETR
jgi:hypothetical protein